MDYNNKLLSLIILSDDEQTYLIFDEYIRHGEPAKREAPDGDGSLRGAKAAS